MDSGFDNGYFIAYNEYYKPFIIQYGIDNSLREQMLERFELVEDLIEKRIEIIKNFITNKWGKNERINNRNKTIRIIRK